MAETIFETIERVMEYDFDPYTTAGPSEYGEGYYDVRISGNYIFTTKDPYLAAISACILMGIIEGKIGDDKIRKHGDLLLSNDVVRYDPQGTNDE